MRTIEKMLRALTVEKMLREHLWISYVFGVYGFWTFYEFPTSWPKCFSEPDELHRAQNIPSPQKSYFHTMTKKQLSCRFIGSHRSWVLFSHEFSTVKQPSLLPLPRRIAPVEGIHQLKASHGNDQQQNPGIFGWPP